MADPFDIGDLFGGNQGKPSPGTPRPNVEEKGVPWSSRTIDGVIYVRLSDVADLLRLNNVLPKVRKGIERRLQ